MCTIEDIYDLCTKNLRCMCPGQYKQQFWGFWGAHGSGYMGPVATTWVPMGAQLPVLSPNDHPNPSYGQQKGFGKRRNLKIFQVPLNSLTRMGSGAAREVRRVGPPDRSRCGVTIARGHWRCGSVPRSMGMCWMAFRTVDCERDSKDVPCARGRPRAQGSRRWTGGCDLMCARGAPMPRWGACGETPTGIRGRGVASGRIGDVPCAASHRPGPPLLSDPGAWEGPAPGGPQPPTAADSAAALAKAGSTEAPPPARRPCSPRAGVGRVVWVRAVGQSRRAGAPPLPLPSSTEFSPGALWAGCSTVCPRPIFE